MSQRRNRVIDPAKPTVVQLTSVAVGLVALFFLLLLCIGQGLI